MQPYQRARHLLERRCHHTIPYSLLGSPSAQRFGFKKCTFSTRAWRVKAWSHQRRPQTTWAEPIGAEPGSRLKTKGAEAENQSDRNSIEAEIRIVDYSDKQTEQHGVAQHALKDFLSSHPRPKWAACRWIYVNGLNEDIVHCLGSSAGLHKLAIEDVLDTSTPTKVDWYEGHCFIVLALSKLVQLHRPTEDSASAHELRPWKSRDGSSRHSHRNGLQRRVKWHGFSEQKFAMSVEQASIFLTSDGTVITIFEHSGQDVWDPILLRLDTSQTILRSSNDPSMLLQAVIDTVVDLSLPIDRAVEDAFSDLELAVLSRPRIEQSKQLYVLRSGLALLKTNINASGSVVRELIGHRAVIAPSSTNGQGTLPLTATPAPTPSSSVTISPTTQVYLQDVHDHISVLATSTQTSMRSAENLTSLIFNTIAASQNESVRQLTLVSCFFLPLTFLTGYFGMNFDPMPVVNNHSDSFFWIVATPTVAGMIVLMVMSRAKFHRSFNLFRRRRARKSSH